jgi:hypothetical protein
MRRRRGTVLRRLEGMRRRPDVVRRTAKTSETTPRIDATTSRNEEAMSSPRKAPPRSPETLSRNSKPTFHPGAATSGKDETPASADVTMSRRLERSSRSDAINASEGRTDASEGRADASERRDAAVEDGEVVGTRFAVVHSLGGGAHSLLAVVRSFPGVAASLLGIAESLLAFVRSFSGAAASPLGIAEPRLAVGQARGRALSLDLNTSRQGFFRALAPFSAKALVSFEGMVHGRMRLFEPRACASRALFAALLMSAAASAQTAPSDKPPAAPSVTETSPSPAATPATPAPVPVPSGYGQPVYAPGTPQPAPAQVYVQPAYPQGYVQPAYPPVYGQPTYPPGYFPPGYVAPGYYAPGYAAPPSRRRYRESAMDPDNPPPGYHTETRIRTGLVVGGAVMFAVPYLLSVSGAISGEAGGSTEYNPLFAPVVGPFIALSTTHVFIATSDALQQVGRVFGAMGLILDGIFQVTGATMLIVGLAAPKEVVVPNSPLEPTLSFGPTGASARWAF